MARERVHDTLYTFHSECSLIINRNVRDNNTYGKAEPAEARVPAGSTVRGEFCAAVESRLPAESRVPGESRLPAGSTVRGEFCAAVESRLPAESRVLGESRLPEGSTVPGESRLPAVSREPADARHAELHLAGEAALLSDLTGELTADLLWQEREFMTHFTHFIVSVV